MSTINHPGTTRTGDCRAKNVYPKTTAISCEPHPTGTGVTRMNKRRITRRHRRTHLSSPPTLKELIQSEIGDLFAGFGSPGEPETPEAIQRELMMRIDNVFDFFLNQ